MVCHRMCDYHHEHLEEEERQTTMVTTTGDRTLGEGRHYDSTTSMITATQDRLQERSGKRTMTSSDYIIRLTDRLLRMGSKISDCFSQISPQKIGPRWVARSNFSFSLEIFDPDRNLANFFDLWALWVASKSQSPDLPLHSSIWSRRPCAQGVGVDPCLMKDAWGPRSKARKARKMRTRKRGKCG